MQAKQEKKSSNKWTCAICNQKQSLQKVFARSGVAKDIRFFVQNFNISSHSQTISHPQTNSPEYEEKHCSGPSTKESKWAEYLDLEEDQNVGSNGDDYDDGTFVTALPDPPLWKRKRQAKSEENSFGRSLENHGLALPNQKKIHGPAKGKEPKRFVGNVGKAKDCPREEGGGSGSATGCFMSEKVSKWASYLDIESSDTNFSKCGIDFVDNELEGGIVQTEWQGQVIDEDVHPDFL